MTLIFRMCIGLKVMDKGKTRSVQSRVKAIPVITEPKRLGVWTEVHVVKLTCIVDVFCVMQRTTTDCF